MMKTYKTHTENEFRKHMETLNIPEGFTARFREADSWGILTYIVAKEGDVEFRFDVTGCGHTDFTIEGGKRGTFDRLGVEDSFYWLVWGGEFKDLNAIVVEQFKRIKKSRAFYKKAIEVPTLPFKVAPSRVVELKRQLQKYGSVTFTPGGFGTGYVVSKNSVQEFKWGGKRADVELEEFLGHSPLYVSSFDSD